MELGNILEFRKDLYFEGAVQADWFYSPERAAKVAENFVFHGNQYFGIEDQGVGNKKRIVNVCGDKDLSKYDVGLLIAEKEGLNKVINVLIIVLESNLFINKNHLI